MILDYSFNKRQRTLSVSYIDDDGSKKILKFNSNRFKTYYFTPNGKYTNWDGAKCDEKWTENPSIFDLKTFFMEMDDKYKNLITKKTFPKLYTWDIEVAADSNGDFCEVSDASSPITTISVVNPTFNTIVLSTREMSEEEQQWCSDQFDNYLDNTAFYQRIKPNTKPKFKYICFRTEKDMLEFFLKNIVAKVPILAGWNCILFDWQYITNRISKYYPELSINSSSCTGVVNRKRYRDIRGDDVALPMPEHTVILDMMDVVDREDFSVLPIKESMSLNYIADASMGIKKIEYKGTLDDLYKSDYPRYVYYNAIDSILVQLINYRFKTMDHIYLYSLYCMEKIDRCFSKIAVTESLVFQDFYKHGLKIVYQDNDRPERSRLVGAYVKKPIPGIHNFVCCNDFASLYPSTIRTCNISFENYIGAFWDEEKLKPYLQNPKYIVVGPSVFENKGSSKDPCPGYMLYTFLDEERLKPYRNDPNYFISVNGCVYRNDKDYAFRRIQSTLKATRDHDKYLGKKATATIIADIKHVLDDKKPNNIYKEEIIEFNKSLGYDITSSSQLEKYTKDELREMLRKMEAEAVYLDSNQLAMKLLMNSMYGGCSHIAFYWYNMNIANDITGESRNLTHTMEHHISEFWLDNWLKMKDLHKSLGIEIDENEAKKALENAPLITEDIDKDAYHKQSFVYACYGDTDSLYLCYEPLLKTIKGYKNMSVDRLRDIIVDINTKFLDKHNKEFIADYYAKRFGKSVHDFELEVIMLSGIWLDVKKRYAGIELWKDGECYDLDKLEMKIKGLEMIKSSFPALSRKQLTEIVRYMLETSTQPYLIQRLNKLTREKYDEFMNANVESVSGSVRVNGYHKYCISDDGNNPAPIFADKCPWNVRALASYNYLINKYHHTNQNMSGGQFKWYVIKNDNRNDVENYFAYDASNYPEWAIKEAPINRRAMFQKTVLDPINRLFEANNMPLLNIDGSIQMSLF